MSKWAAFFTPGQRCVINKYYLWQSVRLSAAVGTSETPHRVRRSPDSAETASGTYGGRGDTPLSRCIFRLRRRQQSYRQPAQCFLGKKDINGQRIASMAFESGCRCLITPEALFASAQYVPCADLEARHHCRNPQMRELPHRRPARAPPKGSLQPSAVAHHL